MTANTGQTTRSDVSMIAMQSQKGHFLMASSQLNGTLKKMGYDFRLAAYGPTARHGEALPHVDWQVSNEDAVYAAVGMTAMRVRHIAEDIVG
jgi:hypothetical protein